LFTGFLVNHDRVHTRQELGMSFGLFHSKIWNKRPDGLTIKILKLESVSQVGEFVILKFKRMSDVTDQYVTRTKHVSNYFKVGVRTDS
jgi:hypothetical protein